MLASKSECSDYDFEMAVHEEGSSTDKSDLSVKFGGSPFSIDEEDEDFNLYCVSVELMSKLVKESADQSSIGVSFKIHKKI